MRMIATWTDGPVLNIDRNTNQITLVLTMLSYPHQVTRFEWGLSHHLFAVSRVFLCVNRMQETQKTKQCADRFDHSLFIERKIYARAELAIKKRKLNRNRF